LTKSEKGGGGPEEEIEKRGKIKCKNKKKKPPNIEEMDSKKTDGTCPVIGKKAKQTLRIREQE